MEYLVKTIIISYRNYVHMYTLNIIKILMYQKYIVFFYKLLNQNSIPLVVNITRTFTKRFYDRFINNQTNTLIMICMLDKTRKYIKWNT